MGRHRDRSLDGLDRRGVHTYEGRYRDRDRERSRRGAVYPGEPRPPRPDEGAVASAVQTLRTEISVVIRSARAERAVSQRELAAAVGVSQSTVSRLESGSPDVSLGAAVRVLTTLGQRLKVAGPIGRPALPAPRLRANGEHVRDGAGRRLPAHLVPYRLRTPHTWWPGTTNSRIWEEPRWSYRRRPGSIRRANPPTAGPEPGWDLNV